MHWLMLAFDTLVDSRCNKNRTGLICVALLMPGKASTDNYSHSCHHMHPTLYMTTPVAALVDTCPWYLSWCNKNRTGLICVASLMAAKTFKDNCRHGCCHMHPKLQMTTPVAAIVDTCPWCLSWCNKNRTGSICVALLTAAKASTHNCSHCHLRLQFFSRFLQLLILLKNYKRKWHKLHLSVDTLATVSNAIQTEPVLCVLHRLLCPRHV